MVFAILAAMRNLSGTAVRSKASGGSELAIPLQLPATIPKSVVDSLMRPWLPMHGEDSLSVCRLTASRPMANGNSESGEAFFRWLDSDIIQRNAVWRNGSTHSQRKRGLLQQASIKAMATSSQPISYYTVEDGASQVGACAIEKLRPPAKDCVH